MIAAVLLAVVLTACDNRPVPEWVQFICHTDDAVKKWGGTQQCIAAWRRDSKG
jgi:entry exclusion lipoprotein TrbK